MTYQPLQSEDATLKTAASFPLHRLTLPPESACKVCGGSCPVRSECELPEPTKPSSLRGWVWFAAFAIASIAAAVFGALPN